MRHFGEHFEESEQERMMAGCRTIAPWIQAYAQEINGHCIEFGPFLNPLLEPNEFTNTDITFLDADSKIIGELGVKYRNYPRVKTICFDLNCGQPLPLQKFRAAVVSQVLNYIDSNQFLRALTQLAEPNSLLFINNVLELGIPELFSERRPKSYSASSRVTAWIPALT
jgi:hypothetical protein